MQSRRIQVNEGNDGVGGSTEVKLTTPTSPREETNFHNIWLSVSAEPETAGANEQGTWVLFLLRENASTPTFVDATTNAELNNAIVIACGIFSASNESPFNYSTQIKTSRTLQAGDSLTLQIVTTGITADLSSNRVMLCAHVTRK